MSNSSICLKIVRAARIGDEKAMARLALAFLVFLSSLSISFASTGHTSTDCETGFVEFTHQQGPSQPSSWFQRSAQSLKSGITEALETRGRSLVLKPVESGPEKKFFGFLQKDRSDTRYRFTPIRAVTEPLIHQPMRWLSTRISGRTYEAAGFIRFLAFSLSLFGAESGLSAYQDRQAQALQNQREANAELMLKADLDSNGEFYDQLIAKKDPRIHLVETLTDPKERRILAHRIVAEWRAYLKLTTELNGWAAVQQLDLDRQLEHFGQLPQFQFAKQSVDSTLGELVPEANALAASFKLNPKKTITEQQSAALFLAQHHQLRKIVVFESSLGLGFQAEAVPLVRSENPEAALASLFNRRPDLGAKYSRLRASLAQIRELQESVAATEVSSTQRVQIAAEMAFISQQADHLRRAVWRELEFELYREQNRILGLPENFGLPQE